MVRTTSIQALDRSVALLEALSAAGPQGISLKQLTEAVGLRASTGRTLLSSMVEHGLVAQNEQTRRYLLGPLVFELERQYVAQSDLSAVAAPVLRKLWEDTRETVHLAVLHGSRRVDISVLVSPQLLNINPMALPTTNQAGSPIYRTAAGKVLFAGLGPRERDDLLEQAPWHTGKTPASLYDEMDRVRGLGYATNFEEEAVGVCGVAAPVLDHSGRTVAALCLGYPSVRHDLAHDQVLRASVMTAAADLSGLLGVARRTRSRRNQALDAPRTREGGTEHDHESGAGPSGSEAR